MENLRAFLDKNSIIDDCFYHLSTFGWPEAGAAADLLKKYGWATSSSETTSLPKLIGEEASDEPLPKNEGRLPDPEAWVISTRADGAAAKGCLHIVGRCHRRPGIHCQRWVVVDASIQAAQYAKACRQCFPTGLHTVALQVEEAEPELSAGMPNEVGFDGLSSSESE